MPSSYVFHIRNANPGDMAAVLAALEANSSLESVADIVEAAEEIGFTVSDRKRLEALATARDLNLVSVDNNDLTDPGYALAKLDYLKPELFPEIVHGIQYRLWNPNVPSAYCFSWSYRALCQLLWQSVSLDIGSRRELASKIETQARNQFAGTDISFSPKSIGGALLWLSDLKPPVLSNEDSYFSRRRFCPPELLVMAIDYVYESNGADFGTNLLISSEIRDTVCQMCLLEPSSFERVLGYAVTQFDFLEQGVGGGWGSYLVLHRSIELEDYL